MVSIKVITSRVRPTYAPIMDPIATGKLSIVLSSGDDCSLGKATAGEERRTSKANIAVNWRYIVDW